MTLAPPGGNSTTSHHQAAVALTIINKAMFTDSLFEIVHVLNISNCFQYQIESVLILSGVLLLSVLAPILNNHR